MSLTDGQRWSAQMHEFYFVRVLRALAMLGKQVMSRTRVVRYSALSVSRDITIVRFQGPHPPPRSQVALQRNRVWVLCAVPSSSLRSDLQPVVFTQMDRLVAETGLGGLIIVCRGFAARKLQTPTLFLHIYMAKAHQVGFQFRYINSLYQKYVSQGTSRRTSGKRQEFEREIRQ